MRHQDSNIIFQPPKEATSGFVIIIKCHFKSRSYSKRINVIEENNFLLYFFDSTVSLLRSHVMHIRC